MNQDKRVSETFLAACDLPVDERGAYLDRACGGDSQLRAEVESLLEHDYPDSLIDSSDPIDPTSDSPPNDPSPESADRELPDQVGRYRIERILGQGGYGVVCLAHDEQLDRQVAIKFPHRRLVALAGDVQSYLDEARTVAGLDHPHIVPVYDVGSTDAFPCYVVSKYIEGTDLSQRIKHGPPTTAQAVELVATIAEALHYAHLQGLVHRDIKPANILIDRDDVPYIVDFGLALRDENIGSGPRNSGTPAYMSPEQACREGHRVDGRSDIFSLGVVLYEMLTARKPFQGDSRRELAEQIISREAKPLRQYDDEIPKELERICLKALSKRATDRYSTANDFAEDLEFLLRSITVSDESGTAAFPTDSAIGTVDSTGGRSKDQSDKNAHGSTGFSSGSRPIQIVPKGLRSFDAHDADFFLQLLPGPRDRDGLPDSLRFWKIRIEENDPDNTFSVGLIYGPSGCGKSSLVKAGLLPRLSDDVIPVYIEATPEETETRLLHGLRKRCPALEDNLNLKETLATLRRGPGIPVGKKVLIVLDQFEQWLHAKKEEENTDLVQALRQCDGGRVQCIVMVRDDFWLAVSRFLRELEVRLVEGENSALTDLFYLEHARKVLAAFGRAFGKLPELVKDTSKAQKDFLKQSVAGLAEEGKVICVRLALFAEMMKGKPWTPATLKEAGGALGVGVTFLEETFSATTAPPEHRLHQKAARAILRALLPDSGTDIKGTMRSHADLLEASGYANRLREFDDLIRILDSEIRLITPTDPAGFETDDESVSHTDVDQKYYQLTHDYLVPSLRDWLTRKQKETRRGRAELRLTERAASWNAKPENRHLPAWWEYGAIRLLTDKKNWSEPQRKMMARARRVQGVRACIGLVLLAIGGLTGLSIRNAVVDEQARTRAEERVDGLLNADIAQVPAIVADLEQYRKWANLTLEASFERSEEGSTERLHTAIALLRTDQNKIEYLRDRLLVVTPMQFPIVRDALLPDKSAVIEPLWQIAMNDEQDAQERFQAACSLATYSPKDQRWEEISSLIAQHLVHVLPSQLLPWRNALRPAKDSLLHPLGVIYRDRSQPKQLRSFAADTLADYAADEPQVLFDLLADSEQFQFPVMLPGVVAHENRAIEIGQAELKRTLGENATEDEKERFAIRQTNAAVVLLRLGEADTVWPLLKHSPDPRVRSYFVNWFRPRGGDPQTIVKRLNTETDPSIRRALVLCLGEFDESQVSTEQREPLIEKLRNVYRTEPDAGLHAAAEWLLRRWDQSAWIADADEQLRMNEEQIRAGKGDERPQWYINLQGQTFVILEVDEFLMGSPLSESHRRLDETLHRKRIGRRFAISAKEVTKQQYLKFHKGWDHDQFHRFPKSDCPIGGVSWYEAAAYCNWLSGQEGIPKEQWCYESNEQGRYAAGIEQGRNAAGMKAKDDYLKRRGYRLPTESEWEYACRSEAITSRHYGLSDTLLPKYAWYAQNATDITWPVGSLKPNDFGLFDMLGNIFEWCHDRHAEYKGNENEVVDDIANVGLVVNNKDRRVLRGASFISAAEYARSANRSAAHREYRAYVYGFRVARTYP